MRYLSLIAFTLMLASMAAAAPEEGASNLGGHGRKEDALRVIEEKCLVCHNRQRIETALDERKEMEKIQSSMEQKGVVLTDKEREVLGHFWRQNPLKGKKEQPPTSKEWQ